MTTAMARLASAVLLSLAVLAEGSQQQPQQHTLFRTLLRHRRQPQGLLASLPGPPRSRMQCTAACLREPRCVALNFRPRNYGAKEHPVLYGSNARRSKSGLTNVRRPCELLFAIGQLKQVAEEKGAQFIVNTVLVCSLGGRFLSLLTLAGVMPQLRAERVNIWVQEHSGIRGHNIPHDERYVSSLDECSRLCLRVPGCRSVDYALLDSSCNLNNVTHETALLRRIEDVTYATPLCACGSRHSGNHTTTTEQPRSASTTHGTTPAGRDEKASGDVTRTTETLQTDETETLGP
ncbi:hypothetical protein HPB47_012941 [Ixodes persulcatus]|uniref:Uncharacterized protein n=1 Tax=Ixodes persulcatus TaxID=34615 RepID=A0AC60NS46_IXOPE|nr:hypothetical protein HPB47_012941 [Ixodes persulcatus]